MLGDPVALDGPTELVPDPEGQDRLFVATDDGVLESCDGGATWRTLDKRPVYTIDLAPGERGRVSWVGGDRLTPWTVILYDELR